MATPALRRSAEPGRDPGPCTTLSARRGFTLVEVLVALAILAVALAAGYRGVSQAAESATVLKARTLALWVAENRLAAAQLETPAPSIGESEGNEAQGGSAFTWHETVTGTPNPAFRRIEISVAESNRSDYVLARLIGYVGQSAQK